jgi:hypothetical protein
MTPTDNKSKPESVFKNSRLMLHEIVDSKDLDWMNPEAFANLDEKYT